MNDGSINYTYAYNGLGQRIRQSVDGTVTSYLLDTQPGLAKVIRSTSSRASGTLNSRFAE